MLGIVVILLVSWGLLHVRTQRHLAALGLGMNKRRFLYVVLSFVFAMTTCVLSQWLDAELGQFTWRLNPSFTFSLLLDAAFWDLKSVLTEELIFRGALLYLLIRWLGIYPGVLISAVVFGVYHWFSYGIFGQLMPMLVVFFGTGIMGAAWALAYVKSGSLWLPVALHFGWNFTHNSLFSEGPLGKVVWVASETGDVSGYWALFNFMVPMVLVPIITLLFVVYFIPTEVKKPAVSAQ